MVGKIKSGIYFVTKYPKLTTRKLRIVALRPCGFTLVELLIVMAIVGILATLAIPSFNAYVLTTKNRTCSADLRSIETAITSYSLDKNTFPPTATALIDVGMGRVLDPWKRTFIYKNLSDVGAVPLEDTALVRLNFDFDLYSKGANGSSTETSPNPDNADDIVRANNGSFVGGRP